MMTQLQLQDTATRANTTIKAIKINEASGCAFYSKKALSSHFDEIVLPEDVEKVRLDQETMRQLQQLLDFNWATIAVLSKGSTYDRRYEAHTNHDTFVITGDYEVWQCHRLGPCGAGSQFNSRWMEIEQLIARAIKQEEKTS